ncbi:MAG TPA: hypothetical protein VGK00_13335 [Anaerolineales bacterium]|jgi:DNA-binding PadR family transcriptional regulator
MSLKLAVPVFLSLRPFSGYDLKNPMVSLCVKNLACQSMQIYRTMTELEEQGFVEK